MPKRDHKPFPLDPVRGLFARGSSITPPQGYLSRARNLVFSAPGLEADELEVVNTTKSRVREDFKFVQSLAAIPVRFHIYNKADGNRIISLDASGNFRDEFTGTIILTIANAIDFHGITIFDRYYFTPHDRETGSPGQFIYVYSPSLNGGLARKAGGDPATGVFTVAASSTAGSIEPGLHIIAISNVTNTGFITKPSLHIQYTAPSPRKKLNLTAIPLGPTGTVARIIWISHVVIGFDGNVSGPELFRAYTINNNTTTSLNDTVDAYDSALISSADPYVDTLQEIPSGTFLTDFDGRLVVCGSKTATEDGHTLYISNQGEPENVDGIDGKREVVKGRGGSGIKTTRPLRGNLYCWKKNMTCIVRPNSDTPVNWPVEIVDESLGAEVYSVSESLNVSSNMFYDVYLVMNQLGLCVFNGSYVEVLKPLSLNIEALWFRDYRLSVQNYGRVLVDPINYRLYVLMKDVDGIVRWYHGDFSDGLSADGIKWSPWDFDYSNILSKNFIDAHIVVNPAINKNNTTVLAITENDNGLRELVTNTFSSGADFNGDIHAEFGVKLSDPEFRDIHLSSVRMLASASKENSIGQYEIQVADFSRTIEPPTEDAIIEVFPNYTNRIIEVLISASSGDLNISAIILYTAIVGLERSDDVGL